LALGVLIFCVAMSGHAHGGHPTLNDTPNDTPETNTRDRIEELRVPLLPVPADWKFNDTWKTRKIGTKDFYFVENGPFARIHAHFREPLHRSLYETGVLQRTIPGFLGMRYLAMIGDLSRANAAERTVLEQYLENRWPIWSISYATAREFEMPDPSAFDTMGELWIGDGSTETMTYRLDGVVNYMRSAKIGTFSSSIATNADSWARFMETSLIPELGKVLPEAVNPGAFGKRTLWTHADARTLSNAFMRTYFEKIGKPIAWGGYLSPYYIAAMPANTTVGERNSNPLFTARARGIMRSAGGNKFFMSWQTSEEVARWIGHSAENGVIPARNESHGYNLNHIRNMMWRPFLTGVQYFIFHRAPTGFINDVEQDGHHEINAIGETFHDIMDMSERLPDRGVAVASVGLLLDGDRNIAPYQHRPTESYIGLRTRTDDPDFMINGLLDHLFPVHDATAGYGLPNRSAPYGEIFDILSPNQRGVVIAPETLDNYKLLFDMGGLQVDAPYARILEDYVRNGGTLLMNAADLGEHLKPAFFGVSLTGELKKGNQVVSVRDGRKFDEATFGYFRMAPTGAEVLYSVDGHPLVTLHRVEKGHAILVASSMIQDAIVDDRRSRLSPTFKNRPLLKMVPHLVDQLTAGTMPIELRCAPEHRKDLTWWVHERNGSWLVFVQSYNQHKRFERRAGTLFNIIGDYEFEPIEFELVSHVPVVDIVDIYGRRNIPFAKIGSTIVATDYARWGDIRIYEFSAEPIELSEKRFVNYAENRPARASQTLVLATHKPKSHDVETQRYSPQLAVDGSFDNRRFWQSGRGSDPKERDWHKTLPLPAWLEIDLEQTRTVDHAMIQFHHRPVRDSVDMVPMILRYTIEVSKNGRSWTTVIDESANAKPLRRRPLTKWFDPVKARYARVTVLANSERRGAQVVEFGVYGKDRESYVARRRSPWSPERPWLPIEVQNWPASKQVYLADGDPITASTRAGKNRQIRRPEQTIRSGYDSLWGGRRYQKVLDVPAPHEVSYSIADGAQTFVAVGGFTRLFADRPGVIYRVFVDGEKRFDSGEYYGFDALPIVVDVRNGRTLRIAVEDMRDGQGAHEALLAEARFLME
jgi:hypothetical protein